MQVILRAEPNDNGEIEITRMSFKSKYQSPLIMIIKEYWFNGDVVNAIIVWETKSILRLIKRHSQKRHDKPVQ